MSVYVFYLFIELVGENRYNTRLVDHFTYLATSLINSKVKKLVNTNYRFYLSHAI